MSALLQAQQALGRGDFGAARQLLTGYVKQHSNDLDGLYLLGVCEQNAQHNDAAKTLYQRVLKKAPQHFGAHYNLAMLLSASGDHQGAMPHHDAAVQLQPGQYWAYVNRGNAKAKLQQYSSALADFEKAQSLDSNAPEAYTNCGNVLREMGQLARSLDQHDTALRLRPNYLDALLNKASTLIRLKRAPEALNILDQVLADQPKLPLALAHRGVALQQVRRLKEAAQCLQHALELEPGNAENWVNLGHLHDEQRQHPEALRCYSHAMQLDPHINLLIGGYLSSAALLCDWQHSAAYLKLMASGIAAGRLAGNPFDTLQVLDDPVLQRQTTEQYVAIFHPVQNSLGLCNARQRTGKIRLGYFSTDFQTHPVSLLAAECFELHDRSKFEVIAFSFGPPQAEDPVRQRLLKAFDQFIDVDELSDREVAELARRMEIDIAINLNGYTLGCRPDVFALRAAPVQVAYLGYAGTAGADYVDYVLTDRFVTPSSSQAHFTERLAYLPDCFMPHDSTQAISSAPITRADFSLPEQGFVFCCFNNHFKLNPTVFDIWMRLLQQVPGSVLWLSSANSTVQSNLAREASARGVDPARLVFAERLERMEDHLARHRLADLFLDSFPYNAHTTAMDALWAGLPVLTCAGQSFASRVAGSLLQTVGLQELITTTHADYETLALTLANDPARLKALREQLAINRNTSPLFDTRRFTAGLETVYERMMAHHAAGHSPQTFAN